MTRAAFEAPLLLRNSHAMTLSLLSPRPGLRRALRGDRSRTFRVTDRTSVTGWMSADGGTDGCLVLLHGLSGDADSVYLRGIAAKAQAAGIATLRLDARSCGRSRSLTPGWFHAGLTEDLRAVLEQLRAEGFASRFVAGYSLGGNVALKLAGELCKEGSDLLDRVAAVSPAIDLHAASRRIDGERGTVLYRRAFLRGLKSHARRKAGLFPTRCDLSGLAAIRTIRAFDERFIAPPFGFRDADDYYDRAAALPWIDRIRVPAYVLHAADDPLVPVASVDRPEVHSNPKIELQVTRHGGHCAFLGRRPAVGPSGRDPDRHFAECRVIEFVRAHGEG
jgi:hypothetical protein